ncbi:MAG: GNAT family N-acetyltransferase [Flavobacteriaceae bacterium]|nr:GNAT family N-acetyltransferase [Flavobacteriaceae bacterium]
MSFLETERLILNKISTRDAPFYVELFNSEDWLKYIGDRNVRSIADAENYIKKNYLPIYDEHGFGSYTVKLKESGKTIGACGLYQRDDLKHPDIGFAFLPGYYGQGYGFEAASEVMRFAREQLGITEILGFTKRENVASIKLLKKLGLREQGTYKFKDDTEDLILFAK